MVRPFFSCWMICLLASAWACKTQSEAQSEPAPNQPISASDPLKGIDVSHYDGDVDWQKIKGEGFHFAFAKGTQGVDYVDPKFAANFKEMKAAGLLRGAYHFYMTNDDPHEQAENVFSNIVLEHNDLPIVVDIETYHSHTPNDWKTEFRVFVDALESHYGVKPIIYTGPHFWNQKMDQDYGTFPLWIAQYDVQAPTLPKGWDTWHFWQYNAKIETRAAHDFVDGNYFNGSFDDLQQFLVKDQER